MVGRETERQEEEEAEMLELFFFFFKDPFRPSVWPVQKALQMPGHATCDVMINKAVCV